MIVVIGTDCIGICKSNYHTISTTTIPSRRWTYRQMDLLPRWRGRWWLGAKNVALHWSIYDHALPSFAHEEWRQAVIHTRLRARKMRLSVYQRLKYVQWFRARCDLPAKLEYAFVLFLFFVCVYVGGIPRSVFYTPEWPGVPRMSSLHILGNILT